MRRRPDQLLPLEEHILVIAAELFRQSRGTSEEGAGWFHAYGIAQLLADAHGGSLLTNGTLYRSLRKMATRGLLDRRVESDDEAATHAGPPRRYYRITPAGGEALEAARRRFKLDRAALRALATSPAAANR